MQTPAPFEYERATSVEGAIAALGRVGPGARVIAGGHSLLPMMKLRLASPEHLVDINDLHELAYIREDGDELAIGALTRHAELLESEPLATAFPLFRDAEQVIADPVVRNRGTIGGSLCQADAAEDLSAVCAAAKARIVIRGADGERTVPISEFHVGPWTTVVGAGEIVTEIRLPLRPGAGSAHVKVERRAGDWAIAAASAAVWMDGDTHRRRRHRPERRRPDHDPAAARRGAAAAARRRRTSCSTRSRRSPRRTARRSRTAAGPVDYKRHLAGVLTKRALQRAVARATGQEA